MFVKFKKIFVYTIPVFAGYVFLGIAFGLLTSSGGYPVWYPVIMSIIMFTGALEFATVPLLANPFDPSGSFIFGLMLSARHLFYGIPMLKKYKDTGIAKIFLIFGLSDETFSILSTVDVPEGVEAKWFYLGVTVLNYSYWNIGTLIGAVFGNVAGNNLEGLDYVTTALFIVLFIEQMKNRTGVKSGLIGLIVSAVVLFTVGASNMVIVSMIVMLVILVLGRRVIDNE